MTSREREEFERLKRENVSLQRDVTQLQSSIDELKQQLNESLAGNNELKKQLAGLQVRLDRLLFQLEKRNKKEFGKKTERHNPRHITGAESQGLICEDELQIVQSTSTELNLNQKKGVHVKHIGTQNLPIEKRTHLVPEEERVCPSCSADTVLLSHKITQQLERLQHSLVRLEHNQEVRSCPKCRVYVVTANKPEPPFPGCLAGSHLLSTIIVNKLNNGLPNFRQQKMFKREQAVIPRSTQSDWMLASALTLKPLHDVLVRSVLQSKVIKTDDTWVKVQDRSCPSKIRKGKMTPYLGDKQHPLTVFDFSPTQSFERNRAFLKNFSGFVQADAATGFDAMFLDGSKIEVGCNAHSRRKADEGMSAEPQAAGEILDIYSKVYIIEEQIAARSPTERHAARQAKSKPLMQELHNKLISLKANLNPTNVFRDGVDYMLNHWVALTQFLDDPDLDIDNNAAERAIKTFVLFRKNSLFFGSDAAGEAAAIHLSFIASCERNDIDPVTYLTDVFERINTIKTSELEQLLPHNWSATRIRS